MKTRLLYGIKTRFFSLTNDWSCGESWNYCFSNRPEEFRCEKLRVDFPNCVDTEIVIEASYLGGKIRSRFQSNFSWSMFQVKLLLIFIPVYQTTYWFLKQLMHVVQNTKCEVSNVNFYLQTTRKKFHARCFPFAFTFESENVSIRKGLNSIRTTPYH